jgi:hypothetical protein
MKRSLSAILIVGGLGLIGYFLIARSKPTDIESQLAELNAQEEALAKARIAGVKPVDDLIKAQSLLKEVTSLIKLKGLIKTEDAQKDFNTKYLDYVQKIKDLGYELSKPTSSGSMQLVKIKN